MNFDKLKWIGRKEGELLEFVDREDILSLLNDTIPYTPASLIFRKTFPVLGILRKATVSICGLGLYDFKINSLEVCDSVLMPLVTEYNKRVLYDVFDITDKLKAGTNVICVELGGGYFSPSPKYWGWRQCWLGNPRLALSVDIEYADGSRCRIETDESWKIKNGAFTKNCIYDGVTLDSNLYDKERHMPHFDDSSWDNAVIVESPCAMIEENKYPHIKVCEVSKPDYVNVIDSLNTVYSFPKNRTGWVKIGVKGRCGDKITVVHAEKLYDNGTLNCESNRMAENTDTYILSGDGVEYFTPKFTYHGFKYAQCIKSSESITIVSIEQEALHSDVKPCGFFECDNEDLNRIHKACRITLENSYLGMPLDCPQRDERLAWLGDAYVTSVTSMYNFDMHSFYIKWLDDVRYGVGKNGDVQIVAPRSVSEECADFSAGYLIIAMNCYKFYGDMSLIEKHYDTFTNYCNFLLNKSENYILPRSKYGDWSSCAPDFVRGDPEYTNTLYLYDILLLMKEFSKLLKRDTAIQKYTEKAAAMKKVLLDLYYDKEKRVFGDGSLFSTSFALLLGLIPDEDIDFNLQYFTDKIRENNYRLFTGIFGTKYVLDALRKYNLEKVAIKVILNTEYPGWLFMIKNSTTLTERWDAVSDSLNHGMFGSVDAQIYKIFGGINVDYRKDIPISIKPYFSDSCNSVTSSFRTKSGAVKVDWIRCKDKISLRILIPEGRKSEFVLHKDFAAKKIICNNKSENGSFLLTEKENIIDIYL